MSELLKLLSDETRLRIITLLSECPCFVTDIHTILNLQQSNTSRHLQRLLVAKIIKKKQCGQSSCYYINQHDIEYIKIIRVIIDEYKKTIQAKKDKSALEQYMEQNMNMLKKKQYMKFKEKYYA